MENQSIELGLLDSEEREQLEYIWSHIPEQDRVGMTQSDVLLVLDLMDDYLEQQGLIEYDDKTGEMTYLDGEVDETEQLTWLMEAVKKEGHSITSTQIQLIMDGELQYGIEQGYYTEEE